MSSNQNSRNTVDILRIEGVMAQGYGLAPKIVMRDKRLTAEAKAIYAYFASFSGDGNKIFPSRDLIIDELGMSAKRYYRHLKLLTQHDYIRIDRVKAAGNLYGQNIYTLVAAPDPDIAALVALEEKDTLNETANVQETDHYLEAPHKDEKRMTANEARELKTKQISIDALRKNLEIDVIKEQYPERKNLVEDIFMAIEDMCFSDQIKIAGSVKDAEGINRIIMRLTADNVRKVVFNLAKKTEKILNKRAYIITCLYNSLYSCGSDADNAEIKREERRQEDLRKEQEEESQKRNLQETYEKCPELLKIDNRLTEIAREKCTNKLQNIKLPELETEYMTLEEKREGLLNELKIS